MHAEEPRLRVLVLSSVFPNANRPSFGVFVKERVRYVAAHSDVVVVAPIAWFPLNRWIRGRERSAAPFVETQEGMTVYHPRFLCIPRFGKGLDGFLYFLGVLPLLLWFRNRLPFDLIDAHFAYPDGLAAVLLGALYRRPVVITVRGDEARLARHRLRRAQMRWALRRAARLVAVSASLRDTVAEIGVDPERVRVIPNGVDTTRFKPGDRDSARKQLGLPGEKFVLLAVGDFIERKGHHRVIELLPQIVTRYPNLLYVAMGEDVPGEGCGSLIRELVRRHALEDHVLLLPPQPHEQIPLWMAAADLFCLATRWEGWCNALMEALSCGLPVVTTRVGGNPEFIAEGEDGFLVPYWDGDAFCDAAIEALARTWDRAKIAQRAQRRGWRQTACQVLEEFHAALAL